MEGHSAEPIRTALRDRCKPHFTIRVQFVMGQNARRMGHANRDAEDVDQRKRGFAGNIESDQEIHQACQLHATCEKSIGRGTVPFPQRRCIEHLKYIDTDKELIKEFLREN